MTRDEQDYHERRARQELSRAALATTESAQRSHRELADLHLWQAQARPLAPANDVELSLVAG